MTPPVTKSGLLTMGTLCSSASKTRNKGGSQESVAFQKRHSMDFESRAVSRRDPNTMPRHVSNSDGFPLTVQDRPSSYKGSSHKLGAASQEVMSEPKGISMEMPPCNVPPQLKEVPKEMQNMMMGRWPVLPTPGSKVLRLYVAGEETDTQAERTWLTKMVYPQLRYYTETLGFHLHVVDMHCLTPTPCTPRPYMQSIHRRVMDDSIDLWLILLNSKLGWALPNTIPAFDYSDIHQRLAARDPAVANYMSTCYKLDENNIPPVYYLLPEPPQGERVSKTAASGASTGSSTALSSQSGAGSYSHQELFDELSYIVNEEQNDLYMVAGFQEEVAMALSRHSSMSDNVLVVRRTLNGLPKELKHPACRKHLDVDSASEANQQLLPRYRHIVSRVERIVSNECILKFSTTWADLEMALHGTLTPYIKTMCQNVEAKLKAAVSRMVERQTSIDPYLAAGLPPVLCQELLLHAHKQQTLLTAVTHPPEIARTAYQHLHNNHSRPLVLSGSTGSGLQTIAAILALDIARGDPSRMVVLRFMTLTPESQTAMAVLFTILEQVSIAFGGPGVFKGLPNLSCQSILRRMSECTSKERPLTIILCDLQMCMMTPEANHGADVAWVTQELPPHISLVLVTHEREISALFSKEQHLAVPIIPLENAKEIFHKRMQVAQRTLTAQQQEVVNRAMKKNPVPMHAVLLAGLAQEWRSHETYGDADVSPTLEGTFKLLLQQSEKVVGKECVSIVLGYLSVVKFGVSDSELEDVMAIDTKLMTALYPTHLPAVRRCPLSIWLFLRHKFNSIIDMAYVYGHRVYRWQRLAYSSMIINHYHTPLEHLHAQLSEYFIGTWAINPKPLPDPSQGGAMIDLTCSVLKQPDNYEKHTNCRKFLCLLPHMLQGIAKDVTQQRISATKDHLLNLRWLVTKLDATSLVQLLDDLQMAICNASSMSQELSWLQLQVARHANALNVSGLQLRSHLLVAIECMLSRGGSKISQPSFSTSVCNLQKDISKSSVPFFLCVPFFPFNKSGTTDKSGSSDDVDMLSPKSVTSNASSGSGSPSPSVAPVAHACLNGILPRDKVGHRVVSISTVAGEIVEWDTLKKGVVKTLKDIDKPSDFVFLDNQRVVVLCNRELKAFDLETGEMVSNIRGMLNIKMPFFHVRDASTVIVLARNRMSVNVLDVSTGQIHATFKAGEDRFLNSLLVSGNGRMLVCGDETQKPSPLLVWELGQSKLLHDLRLPQHEFITSIADITHNGQYVACACKGLYDCANNFVVVYDLLSGQLYRQFRLGASVTAVSVASSSLSVISTLNDGSLAVFDIVSGNCKSHSDGVKAIYNRIQLTNDEMKVVTFSLNAGDMPIACTVAFWDLEDGRFLASYTFNSRVTCCQHVFHNNTILVGLANSQHYVVLEMNKKAFENTASSTSESNLVTRKISEQPLWRIV